MKFMISYISSSSKKLFQLLNIWVSINFASYSVVRKSKENKKKQQQQQKKNNKKKDKQTNKKTQFDAIICIVSKNKKI